jgi:dihydrofolate reductase
LIAAMAADRVIGIENRLPWRLPADMKWFRKHTLGKPIIMGRKTFESFGSKPLPDRLNIVMTRDPDYQAPGAVVVHDIEQAIAAAGEVAEVMVIGGASFYAQMLPRAERLYLTFVHTHIDGDAWFPDYDTRQWREIERQDQDADEKNPFAHSFCIYERLEPGPQ